MAMKAAWPSDSWPERPIRASPFTARMFRQVRMARWRTNSLANHGAADKTATIARIGRSFLPWPAVFVWMEDIAFISNLAFAQDAAGADDEHDDDKDEDQHVGSAGAEEQ